MSYKLDYGEFPTVTSVSTINWVTGSTNPYRWDISQLTDLREWWYIKRIPTDPSGISIAINTENFYYTSNGYYLYVSDGNSFAIVAPMENDKNWNILWNITALLQRLKNIENDEQFTQIFKDTFIYDSSDTGSMYVYTYLDEVL
jgi:hypothetical protein